MVDNYQEILMQVSLVCKAVDKVARQHNLPKVKFEVQGHTNCKDPAKRGNKYHMKLSRLRAKAVVNHLNKRGVRSSMLVPKAFGGTRPEVDWSSEDNQRVDFFIPEPTEAERKHARQKKFAGSKMLGRMFGM